MENVVAPKGRLIVKEVELENKTSGGIILTTTNDPDNTSRFGEVISNGVVVDKHLDNNFKVGTKIYFGKYAGATVVFNNEKYVSLTESEVVAIVS